jgi:hypothetical protein
MVAGYCVGATPRCLEVRTVETQVPVQNITCKGVKLMCTACVCTAPSWLRHDLRVNRYGVLHRLGAKGSMALRSQSFASW